MWEVAEQGVWKGTGSITALKHVLGTLRCTTGASPPCPWQDRPTPASQLWHSLCPLPRILPLDFFMAFSLYSDTHRALGLLSMGPRYLPEGSTRNRCLVLLHLTLPLMSLIKVTLTVAQLVPPWCLVLPQPFGPPLPSAQGQNRPFL